MMRNQRGLTLTEMMVAVAVTGIVIVGSAQMVATLISQISVLEQEAMQRENAARFQSEITRVLAQAMNMQLSALPTLNNYNSGTTIGQFRPFNSAALGLSGRIETLAVFLREAGVKDGLPTPTAIFFQAPTPNSSGVIYINHGSNGALKPDPSGMYFDGIVELEINPARVMSTTVAGPARLVTKAEFRVVFRYFPVNKQTAGAWCPTALMASSGCVQPTGAKDAQTIFSVVMHNALFNQSPTQNILLPFINTHYFNPRDPASL